MPRKELRFRIGDAFPAEDPIARWLTVLAMASNDFFRMFRWIDGSETEGTRLLAFRIQTAAIFEAAAHLRKTIQDVPEVKEFIAKLPEDAVSDSERLLASVTLGSDDYIGDWAEPHRNVTFHYPKLHAEAAEHRAEELKGALEKSADLTGCIMAQDTFGSVRFGFADEVSVQLLPEATPENAEAIEAIRETGLALVRFVQHAANLYLSRLPAGTVTKMDCVL